MSSLMAPSPARWLVVNADDLGLSPGVNRGIIQAYEQGIVSSASLMVRYPAAAEAADYARQHRELGLGLHVDLGEWICRAGEWSARYEVVPLGDVRQVRDEVRSQLKRFIELTGLEPDHIDSHQHVHQQEPVLSVVRAEADARNIPLRHCSSVNYRGGFYGQDEQGNACRECISPGSLIAILRDLSDGVTELCCHPGLGRDLETTYLEEREEEVRALCHPSVRQELLRLAIRAGTFAQARTTRYERL
jgi:chitin disaccharide deacetylase